MAADDRSAGPDKQVGEEHGGRQQAVRHKAFRRQLRQNPGKRPAVRSPCVARKLGYVRVC